MQVIERTAVLRRQLSIEDAHSDVRRATDRDARILRPARTRLKASLGMECTVLKLRAQPFLARSCGLKILGVFYTENIYIYIYIYIALYNGFLAPCLATYTTYRLPFPTYKEPYRTM